VSSSCAVTETGAVLAVTPILDGRPDIGSIVCEAVVGMITARDKDTHAHVHTYIYLVSA